MENWKKVVGGLLLIILIFISFFGISQREPSSKPIVQSSLNSKTKTVESTKLLVSHDFGEKTVYEKSKKDINGISVADFLASNCTVEFAYDGNFVNKIEGTQSKKRSGNNPSKDWFYFVNGVLSDVGARDYSINNGDSIWWDYHGWGGRSFTPAVIGSYPEPFLNGFRGNHGAKIVFFPSDERKKQGDKLLHALKKIGVGPIEITACSEDITIEKQIPTIVFGTWDELSTNELFKDLNMHSMQTGANVTFSKSKMTLLNYRGKEIKELKNGYAIIATGTGMGDKSPFWFIVGMSEAELSKGITLFTENPEKLKGHFGIAISDSGEFIPLPCSKEAGEVQ